jgi:hypothetical protein
MKQNNLSTLELGGIAIPQTDWDNTPASVKALVSVLLEELSQLRQNNQQMAERLSHLEEQLKQNSSNSSRPPSSDGFGTPKSTASKTSNQKRGGQKGHPGHSRKLYPPEACQDIINHHPSTCRGCGEPLCGEDSHPYRHQIVELPVIEPVVIEHRLHELECEHCGSKTRAQWPDGVHPGGYGERLSALTALLSGAYHQSHQQVKTFLDAAFGIDLSTGSINRLRQEISTALSTPVAEAHTFVQQQPVLHSDETSFPQGNSDGGNQDGKQGWLWVAVTPLVSVFRVLLSRSQAAAQTMIGSVVEGIVVSDRYSGYGWIDSRHRQACWAHLKRDFIAMAERSGVSQDIGEQLLKQEKALFALWYQVRDGTLERDAFAEAVKPIRATVRAILEEGASYEIGAKEKTPLAKTVRTCRQLLLVEDILWTFVTEPGVEPTNNAAERSLRRAVIWKRLSFGSQSQGGSEFVARMLTAVTSLRAQQRDVLEFLTEVYRASRLGQPVPSLLPVH